MILRLLLLDSESLEDGGIMIHGQGLHPNLICLMSIHFPLSEDELL